MIKACEALGKTSLFAGLERTTFQNYCALTRVRSFAKGEIVVAEGDLCSSIGVIEKGRIAMQKYTTSGDFATISLLKSGDFFGEDLIFGTQNYYAFTFEAMSATEVLFVNKDVLSALMNQSSIVKANFLRILSDRVSTQNKRIALLAQKSIRHKIAFYLMELKTEQESTGQDIDSVRLPVSKEVIAKLLAMPRPSFSRELIHMQKDGLIEVSGRDIKLLDIVRLESEIVEGFKYDY